MRYPFHRVESSPFSRVGRAFDVVGWVFDTSRMSNNVSDTSTASLVGLLAVTSIWADEVDFVYNGGTYER